MDVNQAKARDAILEHQDILKSVRAQAEAEAEAVAEKIYAEAKATQERRAEADRMRYKSDLVIRTQRARDRNNRYYYRGRRYRRYR